MNENVTEDDAKVITMGIQTNAKWDFILKVKIVQWVLTKRYEKLIQR